MILLWREAVSNRGKSAVNAGKLVDSVDMVDQVDAVEVVEVVEVQGPQRHQQLKNPFLPYALSKICTIPSIRNVNLWILA